MKILCYGDSNTWGYIPNINGYSKTAINDKYANEICWWFDLKFNNVVYVNGVCGRCINNQNPWLTNTNALKTIKEDIKNLKNIDLIIIQLGTNDCKNIYNNSPEKITQSLSCLINEFKKNYKKAYFIIISPARNNENTLITQKYYIGAKIKTEKLSVLYSDLCKTNGYYFIDGLDLDIGEDGEHLSVLGHKQLSEKVKKILLLLNNDKIKTVQN